MAIPVLYTQTGCVDSRRVRSWLQQRQIPFEERNVTEDPVAMADLVCHQVFATPLLVIDEFVIFGFQPAEMDRVLRSVNDG
ncbi:MAG TPA: glutaredoxin family protein [Nitrolancea sp.]|nr:glutaredoxin family protein [Nitrolancea sp.]